MIKSWQKIIVRSLHVNGMTLYPFILIRKHELVANRIFINHERIHLRQQTELLILPFYVLYVLNYIFNRMKYKQHDAAYRNIWFEREAYAHETDLGYLKHRKLFAWVKYI